MTSARARVGISPPAHGAVSTPPPPRSHVPASRPWPRHSAAGPEGALWVARGASSKIYTNSKWVTENEYQIVHEYKRRGGSGILYELSSFVIGLSSSPQISSFCLLLASDCAARLVLTAPVKLKMPRCHTAPQRSAANAQRPPCKPDHVEKTV